jgi:hypothetical protein
MSGGWGISGCGFFGVGAIICSFISKSTGLSQFPLSPSTHSASFLLIRKERAIAARICDQTRVRLRDLGFDEFVKSALFGRKPATAIQPFSLLRRLAQCQNKAKRIMIGKGMPNIQSRRPRPMMCSWLDIAGRQHPAIPDPVAQDPAFSGRQACSKGPEQKSSGYPK